MKKVCLLLLTIGLLLPACNSIDKNITNNTISTNDNLDSSPDVSEVNSIQFDMLDHWKEADSSFTTQHLVNDDHSSTIIIQKSSRMDFGDLSLNEYLERISEIYTVDDTMKVVNFYTEGTQEENFGLINVEVSADSSTLKQLQVYILLDHRVITVSGQNFDNSDPENLKDTLLEIAMSIKENL